MLGGKPRKSVLESLDYHPIEIRPAPWATAAEPLCGIRRAVFVAEQGIDETIEFGDPETDGRARHWLAITETGDPVGCVRLLDDRLDRLAVLPAHRRQGIGGALVRRVIREALGQGQDRLYLHAQSTAVGFYETLGFAVEGAEFREAGLTHRRMVYDLNRLRPARSVALPAVDPESRVRQPLEGGPALAAWAAELVPTALRRVRILSTSLEPTVFDDDRVRDRLLALATSHPQAEVRLLIRDPRPLVQASHRLVKLAQRLPSLILLRQLPADSPTPEDELLVTDGGALLCWQQGRPPLGYAIRHIPRAARQLTETFDELWHQSREIPELRTLSL
ncbi:MAG: hypothetical protein CMK33_01715 [Porticoccaceae bacterium]|nr:hypothetical protein [Porticoccaceae bacterium]